MNRGAPARLLLNFLDSNDARRGKLTPAEIRERERKQKWHDPGAFAHIGPIRPLGTTTPGPLVAARPNGDKAAALRWSALGGRGIVVVLPDVRRHGCSPRALRCSHRARPPSLGCPRWSGG